MIFFLMISEMVYNIVISYDFNVWNKLNIVIVYIDEF